MIMGDKSISIVLYSDKLGIFDTKTMEVWFRVARAYKPGAEFILVSMGELDTSAWEFQVKHEADGVRMVSIPAVDTGAGTIKTVMKEAYYWVEGKFVLLADARSYPNSNTLDEAEVDTETLTLFHVRHLKEPFNYSMMKEVVAWNPTYKTPPDLEEEPFVLPFSVFRGIAQAMVGDSHISGTSIATAALELAPLTVKRSSKSDLFIVYTNDGKEPID